MARGRMISNSLSTSEKFASLVTVTPELFEFCHALYPLLVSHTDDFGRLQGDAFTVKAKCYPASPRPLAEVERGLQRLDDVGLIVWYAVSRKRFIQIVEFEKHQQGLHKRTRSQFPRVPGSSGNDEEFPGQEKGREENRREGNSTPQTPLAGGRLLKRELRQAQKIRDLEFGCRHEPRCPNQHACLEAIVRHRLRPPETERSQTETDPRF